MAQTSSARYSRLSQSGGAGLTRTFYRPKGLVSLAWKPSDRLALSAKIQREVGQLNFFDFVASVNVGAGFNNAGNPQLVPQQSWNVDLEGTRNFGALGTATLRLYARRYTDVVDVIPIGATGQAPGNLDSEPARKSMEETLNLIRRGFEGRQDRPTRSAPAQPNRGQLTGLSRRATTTQTAISKSSTP